MIKYLSMAFLYMDVVLVDYTVFSKARYKVRLFCNTIDLALQISYAK